MKVTVTHPLLTEEERKRITAEITEKLCEIIRTTRSNSRGVSV